MGVILVLIGISIIINPKFYHSGYRYYFDFTEIKWPSSILLILLGGLFFGSSFRKKMINSYNDIKEQESVLMCPICVRLYQKKDVHELKCPSCNENLEKLKGFYERHPELKKA